MALKEWYVQLERIKSNNIDYYVYLVDGRRHQDQTIKPIGNIYEQVKSLEKDREIWHMNMKRGGHIPSSSYSLLISFPFTLTSEQWNIYNREVLKEFFEVVLKVQVPNYDEALIESLINRTVMVTHKSDHTHFMLPKILNEEKVVLDFSKKKFSYALKHIVNKKLESNFNISKTDYEVEERKKKQKLSNINIEKMENNISEDNKIIAKGEILEELTEITDALKRQSEKLKAKGGDTRIVDNTLNKILGLIAEGKTRKALRMGQSEKRKRLKGQR